MAIRVEKELKKYKTYCTGCGLCHSVNGVTFQKDEKGFPVAQLNRGDFGLCNRICLASGSVPFKYDGSIWGNTVSKHIAFSTDKEIRNHAASGGVLTSLSLYLLESNKVDGIIQVCGNSEKPYETIVHVSTTREDILNCSGSRYCISTPLMDVLSIIDDKRYAFIGKPCDVLSLRNYANVNKTVKEHILYYLTFFCAGEPSELANLNLIKALGCKDGNDCKSLTYRGNGWPGFATAVNKRNETETMTYNDSWGKILGRDVRKVCRVCSEGTGDSADISCGDAWYSNVDGSPDFSEHDGRNIVFTRTMQGDALFNEAVKAGYIDIDDKALESIDLTKIQNYQFIRKATLCSMQNGYRFCGLDFPHYDSKLLKEYGNNVSLKTKTKRFFGVIKRHLKGKI